MGPLGGETDATSSTSETNVEGRAVDGKPLDGGDAEWHQVLNRHFKPLLRNQTDGTDSSSAASTSTSASAAAAATSSLSAKVQPCYYVYVGGMLLERGKGGQKDLDDLERPHTMDGDLDEETVGEGLAPEAWR